MLQRHLEKKVVALSKKFPIVAITGPRQSGKTTFIKTLFKNYKYVSLEDMDMRDFAQNDPIGFLREYGIGSIIDEIQRVPQLFSYLQTKVDSSTKTGQYIISGSQNFLLLHNISQSLAGRVALFKLLPFSIAELEQAKKTPASLEKTIFSGFYPRLFDKRIHPTDFYPSYIETYVERDVRYLTNVNDLDRFRLFIKLCAGRIGQIINLQSLANDVGISQPTAKSWLSILEASYIIFRLNPFHANFNKRLIKSPKLYFYDTGLACSLLGITQPDQLKTHYLKGGLFENLVILDMYKSELNKGVNKALYFWRDSNGNEIDLLWEDGQKINLAEIKYNNTFSQNYLKGLNSFLAPVNYKLNKKWLVLGNHTPQLRAHIHITGYKKVPL